jgi:outer membrane protein
MKMKRVMIFCIFAVVFSCVNSYAGETLLVQAAAGGWYASPSGETGWQSPSDISFSDNLGYDEVLSPEGRIKAYLPVLPNIYVMGAGVNVDGKGKKSGFGFGGQTFTDTFSSELTLNKYDFGIFFQVPFLKLATLNTLNIEAGANMRLIDAEMTIQDAEKTMSKSAQTWVPMLFGAAELRIGGGFSIEAEARLSSYDNQQWFSGIARMKQDIAHLLFIAGGYRYDDMDMETDGLKIDTEIKGPFLEIGFYL